MFDDQTSTTTRQKDTSPSSALCLVGNLILQSVKGLTHVCLLRAAVACAFAFYYLREWGYGLSVFQKSTVNV